MMNGMTETDRIERDLAATRARMDNRLDELQDHLTAKQMLNDAFAYFRGELHQGPCDPRPGQPAARGVGRRRRCLVHGIEPEQGGARQTSIAADAKP